MPNPLTGDFAAVVQVSGATINRLMASLHQNAFANPATPSFPHSIQIRLGDDRAIDGAIGTVKVQIGVPLVELIHGSTDRFWIEVPVRARYLPDVGSKPLPRYMNGSVRAQYRIEDIDPRCLGWSEKAGQYVWVRVVPDTVAFRGTTAEEAILGLELGGGPPAPDPTPRITRQIAALLVTRFAASPHRVSSRFKKGRMRSLVTDGGAAVVAPVSMDGGDPAGAIASVNGVFLDGADFAIAISRDQIMALAEKALAPVRGFNLTVHVHVSTPWPLPDVDTVYHVTTDPPSVQWLPFGSFGVFKVKVSGRAKTNSILPDATFSIEQDLVLSFDGARLHLAGGSRKITVTVTGLGAGTIASRVRDIIDQRLTSIVTAVSNAAQSDLDAMIGRTAELADQLKTLDANAGARIESASFIADGMVLRGSISLSARRAPVLFFEKTAEQDGHTAVNAWIPGGRIDRFEWSWVWFNSASGPGSRSFADRFVLRRPRLAGSAWGGAVGVAEPVPGIDGDGRVCLRVRGSVVNPVTGGLDPVVSAFHCERFGLQLRLTVPEGIGRGRLFVREPELSQDVPFPQLALVDMAHRSGAAANTLLLFSNGKRSPETVAALKAGFPKVRRTDAGLVLLVMLPTDRFELGSKGIIPELNDLGLSLGLPMAFAEDVGDAWARGLDLRPGAWRLVTPAGDVAWKYDSDEPIRAAALTSALDRYLAPSLKPTLGRLGTTVGIGSLVHGPDLMRPDFVEEPCPPLPLGRAGVGGTKVIFAQASSAASEARIKYEAQQALEAGDRAPMLVVVFDGLSAREAERWKRQHGVDIVALGDEKGIVTDSFGARTFPTTLSLDSSGIVARVDVGRVVRHDEATGDDAREQQASASPPRSKRPAPPAKPARKGRARGRPSKS